MHVLAALASASFKPWHLKDFIVCLFDAVHGHGKELRELGGGVVGWKFNIDDVIVEHALPKPLTHLLVLGDGSSGQSLLRCNAAKVQAGDFQDADDNVLCVTKGREAVAGVLLLERCLVSDIGEILDHLISVGADDTDLRVPRGLNLDEGSTRELSDATGNLGLGNEKRERKKVRGERKLAKKDNTNAITNVDELS